MVKSTRTVMVFRRLYRPRVEVVTVDLENAPLAFEADQEIRLPLIDLQPELRPGRPEYGTRIWEKENISLFEFIVNRNLPPRTEPHFIMHNRLVLLEEAVVQTERIFASDVEETSAVA